MNDLTPYQLFQLERYGNVLPEPEPNLVPLDEDDYRQDIELQHININSNG